MTRKTLWCILGVLGACSSAIGLYFLVWISRIRFGGDAACGCEKSFFYTHPFLILFLGLLLLLPFFGVFRGIIRAVVVHVRTNRVRDRALRSVRESLEEDVFLFEDSAPHAFTVGFFHPKTYVSTGAWCAMHSEDERRALLLHESAHRTHKDPLVRYILLLLSAVIGWIPGVRRVLKAEELFMELRADATAEEQVGRDVLSVVFETLSHVHASSAAVSSFVGAEERVGIHIQAVPFSRVRTQSILLAMCSIVVLALSFVSLSAVAAEQAGGHCVAIALVCKTHLRGQSRDVQPVSTPSSLPYILH